MALMLCLVVGLGWVLVQKARWRMREKDIVRQWWWLTGVLGFGPFVGYR